ncbi:hypothetical protein [Methanothermobacter sp.]|uniref:hypothetical protein n=1 Tax=Methanothermobacter sp. TaxID=1884223 RepID=UPI0026115FEE|nr:hypothetical protein [Methanothermobacter sp.]MDI9618692.1 hypothetical protein [Methanothermobacter sp.]
MSFSDASSLPFLSFGRLNSLLRVDSVVSVLEAPFRAISGDLFLKAGFIAFSGVIFLIGVILDGSAALDSDANTSSVEDFISFNSFVGVLGLTFLASVDSEMPSFRPSDPFPGFPLSTEGTLLLGAPSTASGAFKADRPAPPTLFSEAPSTASGAFKADRPAPPTLFSEAPSTASGALNVGCFLTGALLAGLTFFLGVFFSATDLMDSRSILPANRRVIMRPGTKRMSPRKNMKISGGVAKPSDMK